MTLFRQLFLLIFTLLFLAFLGAFSLTQYYTAQYIQRDVQLSAQHTADLLGIALTKPLSESDRATVTQTANAVMDGQAIASLSVFDVRGNPVYQRHLTAHESLVPQWFMQGFIPPVPTVTRDSVLAGRVVGTLSLQPNRELAAASLWNTLLTLFGWTALLLALSAGVCVSLLRWLLAPLQSLTEQAHSIARQEFAVIDHLPRTRDLHEITHAMNSLSTQLQDVFSAQADYVQELQKDVCFDRVTGLKNRRAFDELLGHLISEPEEFCHGYLLMFEISGLKQFNEQHGYQAGDALLITVADVLTQGSAGMPVEIIAHLSGAYFALLTREVNDLQMKASCDYLLNQLRERFKSVSTALSAHAGIVLYVPGLTLETFLAGSDTALRAAQQDAPFTWKVFRHTPQVVNEIRNAREWHGEITRILADEHVLFSQQACCLARQDDPAHHEVFLRARGGDNSMLSAGQIIPFAERFNLAIEIDKKMLFNLLLLMQQTPHRHARYVVNISQSSLCSTAFLEWLVTLLTQYPQQAKCLTIELVDAHVTRNLVAAKLFTQRLASRGCQFGIDHFGRDCSSFAYLASMKVTYLKLDGSFTRNIHFNQDNQFYVRAMVHAAHLLGMQVYATHVENQQQWDRLVSLGIDGGQGQYLSASQLVFEQAS